MIHFEKYKVDNIMPKAADYLCLTNYYCLKKICIFYSTYLNKFL